MKTEYLIPLDTKNHFAESESGFNHLLMANEEIEIRNGKIKYKNFEFKYKLQSNPIEKSNINCYHLTVENSVDNSQFDSENTEVKIYLDLLRIIKTTFIKYTKDFEILWDDTSFCCSQKAYPMIYEIENLMRKLLTKFMLVNVGTKWEKENIPSKIDKSKNQGKEINVGNSLLYQLDFIELSTFLFEPYSTKNSLSDLKAFVNNKDDTIFSVLEQYIPKSNWVRYFNDVVSAEDEYLKKKWEELYKLRCKVAHNNLFGLDDLKRVRTIVTDLKPYINNAIKDLDKITISEEDKESISENLAINTNEQVGHMIVGYNELYDLLLKKYSELIGKNELTMKKMIPVKRLICDLASRGVLDNKEAKIIEYIIRKRNLVVHSSKLIEKDEIEKIIKDMEECILMLRSKWR